MNDSPWSLIEFSGPDGFREFCLHLAGAGPLCAACFGYIEDVRATTAVCSSCSLAVHASTCIQRSGRCVACDKL
jgi:hypothetical protein